MFTPVVIRYASCKQPSWTLSVRWMLISFTNSSPSPLPSGDTLLAIRAPIGTQLEVPVPEAVSGTCGIFCFAFCTIQLLTDFSARCPGPQWPEEIPDPTQELHWSHRGVTGQQRPVQCLPCGSTRPSSGRCPPESPDTNVNTYLSAVHCRLPGPLSPHIILPPGGDVITAATAALHFSSNVEILIFPSLQVTKASSTKSGPAAITSAANQTASVTGEKHSGINSCM